jgi:hypothetical protein
LGATADAYTPVENGERVFANLDNGYLITTEGGPHVTFGWGNACPDEIVTAFLVEGQMPEEKETRCEGVIAEEFVPNAQANAADYADPLEAMNAAYNEIYYLPEYYWDTSTLTSWDAGTEGHWPAPSDEGQQFHLSECLSPKVLP